MDADGNDDDKENSIAADGARPSLIVRLVGR